MEILTVVLFVLLGVGTGSLTGLIPGIHPNLLATLFVGFAFAEPFLMSLLIISAVVTHSFLSFIPAVYLGACEEDTAMGALPGHSLLLEGRGYEAVRLTIIGGLVSLIFILALLPLIFTVIPSVYETIRPNIHWVLISVMGFVILRDKNRIPALVILVLSGFLGYIVLDLHFMGRMALFPMLTGLFGLSILFYSIKTKPVVPDGNESINFVGKKDAASGGLLGSLGGMLAGLLPGIGSAQSAFLAQEILGGKSRRKFMMAIGGINTSDVIFSLLALWLIGNPRSGAAVAVSNLMESLSLLDVAVFIVSITIAGGLAGALTLVLSRKALDLMKRVNYQKLCLSVIMFLFFIIGLLSGWKGILVATSGTFIGLTCLSGGVRRSYMMGSLIIPTILFFL